MKILYRSLNSPMLFASVFLGYYSYDMIKRSYFSKYKYKKEDFKDHDGKFYQYSRKINNPKGYYKFIEDSAPIKDVYFSPKMINLLFESDDLTVNTDLKGKWSVGNFKIRESNEDSESTLFSVMDSWQGLSSRILLKDTVVTSYINNTYYSSFDGCTEFLIFSAPLSISQNNVYWLGTVVDKKSMRKFATFKSKFVKYS